jgi:mycothiol synthase
MRRPLPLESELSTRNVGFATRPFVFDSDADTWLAVNNAAFATHPEQGSWDLTTLRARLAEPWFDAEGFLIHESAHDEGSSDMAGFCWTKIHTDDPNGPIGEIYVIAVNPTHAGEGLGSRLTIAGLDWLAAKGCTSGMLYVDRDNVAAVTMYEKLGFTTRHRERAFVGDVH